MASTPRTGSSLDTAHRIVVLHGPERFLIEDATRRLVANLEQAHGRIERFSFAGETARTAEVLDELRTFGLFGPHKLVVLDDADVFLKGGRGASDDEDNEEEGGGQGPARRRAFEAYAERPNAEATLLMRARSWKAGKLDNLIKKVGAFVKCEVLKDQEALTWCKDAAKERHKTRIETDAAKLLVERVGPDLLRLDAELEKLAVYAGSKPITREIVDELVGGGREDKAWALQTAILTGSPAAALGKVDQLLEMDKDLKVLLNWAIADLLRKLHTAAQLLRQGVRLESRSGELRLWGAEGERVKELARHGPARYARLLREAMESDQRTKSGRGDARRNLEALTLLVTDSIRCT